VTFDIIFITQNYQLTPKCCANLSSVGKCLLVVFNKQGKSVDD